jgi:hypothetical protein
MDDPEVGGAWAQEPLLYERRGDRFVRASCGEPWCERRYHGRAAAFGDLDGDGAVDALVTTLGGPPLVLRNDAAPARWLVVRLQGSPPDAHAYGSLVEVTTAAGTQRRWVTGGGSYQSVDAPEAAFGLGAVEGPVGLRVTWPDGAVTVVTEAPTDVVLVVRRPGPAAATTVPGAAR